MIAVLRVMTTAEERDCAMPSPPSSSLLLLSSDSEDAESANGSVMLENVRGRSLSKRLRLPVPTRLPFRAFRARRRGEGGQAASVREAMYFSGCDNNYPDVYSPDLDPYPV